MLERAAPRHDPSAQSGDAPPTGSVSVTPGNIEVEPTRGHGSPVMMKQWLITWFERSGG